MEYFSGCSLRVNLFRVAFRQESGSITDSPGKEMQTKGKKAGKKKDQRLKS